MTLYVKDTVLYTQTKKDIGRVHTKTKEKPRLTDGKGVPPVTVIKPEKEEKRGSTK